MKNFFRKQYNNCLNRSQDQSEGNPCRQSLAKPIDYTSAISVTSLASVTIKSVFFVENIVDVIPSAAEGGAEESAF